MSFPAFAHALAAAPIETDGALTSLAGWLKAFENLTGHRFDPMAALSVLTPVLIQAVLTKNPMLIVTAIVIHPADPKRMLAGSAGGGVWFTKNGGARWDPVDDFMANLAVIFPTSDPAKVKAALATFSAETPLKLAA